MELGAILCLLATVAGVKLVYRLVIRRRQLQIKKKQYEQMVLEKLRKDLSNPHRNSC